MEEIRCFSCDKLLQFSNSGNDVGGVLFGTRRDDLIRILTWRPMACDHTQGEGLRLSFNDRMNLAVQLEVARQNSDLKDLRPLGWFVSHVRGGVSLSPSDLEIYNGFFPEAWQVALVIAPQGTGRAQAGFFVRETDQKAIAETSYQCFDLEPMQAPTVPAFAPPKPEPALVERSQSAQQVPTAPPAPAAQPVQRVQAPAIQPQPPAPPVSRVEPSKPSPPARELPVQPFQPPSFEIDESVPTHERWLWAIPIVLALGIAAFLLYQRRSPAIALRVTNEAQTVQIAWDANSRAVRESDRGEIEIDDGGRTSQVSLTGEQLHAGKMSYLPQSSDVSIVMTIHPGAGEPIHESTRLIAPVFHATTQPPQLLTPDPVAASPTAPPGAGHDALERQVQQLRDDLAKERARSGELQNLIRILEQRLGIQSASPDAVPRR
jgi:proteasome lid subunit RPN8/RPN11